LHLNIFERLAYFVLIFLLLFKKGPAFWNFGSHYFCESQIFDKQLCGLPFLQYPSFVQKSHLTFYFKHVQPWDHRKLNWFFTLNGDLQKLLINNDTVRFFHLYFKTNSFKSHSKILVLYTETKTKVCTFTNKFLWNFFNLTKVYKLYIIF
jgi:hypothetical protein